MMRFLLSVLLLLFMNNGYGQIFPIEGLIIDADTREPVPFAHCRIVTGETNTGFVSDGKGRFSHTARSAEITVVVSSIGYHARKVTLQSGTNSVITLEPDVIPLQDVVITYVDYERELLKRVISKIPDNYPDRHERVQGKIIEQLAKDSLYTRLIYSAEARIEADKFSYTRKTAYSNVKVLDGEVIFYKPMDSTFTRLYAGAHNVHRFDVVAAREEPFDNPANRKYQFELIDTLKYNEKMLFCLRFEATKYNGFLYIQDSTFAVVKAEYTTKPESLNGIGSSAHRLFLHFTTEYFRADDYFRISYVNYRTGFARTRGSKEKVFLNNFYYLNDFHKADKVIEFNESLSFSNILIDHLPFTKATAAQSPANGDQMEKSVRSDRFTHKIMRKITIAEAVGVLQYNSPIPQLSVTELDLWKRLDVVQKGVLVLGFGYQFSKSLALEYSIAGTFRSREASSNSLLFSITQPLSRNQRWQISAGAGIDWQEFNFHRGHFTGHRTGIFNGISFSIDPIAITERSKQMNLLSEIRLRYRIKSRFFLMVNGRIPYSLRDDTILTIQQGEIVEEVRRVENRRSFETGYRNLSVGFELMMR